MNFAGDDSRVFKAAQECQALLVCGGDGTISWTVHHLVKAGVDIPVGVIPSGTANDFASALGLSGNPVEVAAKLFSGREIRADIGQVNENCFINVVSTGAWATVPQAVNPQLKRRLGILAYYLEGLQQIRNLAPVPLTLEADGVNTSVEAMILLVMNSSSVGTFKNVALGAEVSDGWLDVLLVRKCPAPHLIAVLLEVYRGEGKHLQSPFVDYFKCQWLKVSSPLDVPTDVDGEPGPELPLNIKVLPQRLRILVPG